MFITRHFLCCCIGVRPSATEHCDIGFRGCIGSEIWIAFAEKTGIEALRRTTREEPDYDVLMQYRLDILKENNLKLTDIQEVIGGLAPLEGAKDFLDALRAKTQVVILSDTFLQFATPLMRQLDWPAIFCHHLEVENDVVENYCLRSRTRNVRVWRLFGH